MLTIAARVRTLRMEEARAREEADRLERLKEEYEDLGMQERGWDVVPYSGKVNGTASHTELLSSEEGIPELWLYAITNYGKVYTNPPKFVVGDITMNGCLLNATWERELRLAGIPRDTIEQARKYLRRFEDAMGYGVIGCTSALGEEEAGDE